MRILLPVLVAVLVAPLALHSQDAARSSTAAGVAATVIARAARAMGADRLETLEYTGTGSSFTVGQAPGPGAPWPRFQVVTYVGTINYLLPVMREQMVRRDVENPPRGGGAGPFTAATGQGGMRPIPGDINQTQVRDARTDAGAVQIALTPHGFLKAAAAAAGASVTMRRDTGRDDGRDDVRDDGRSPGRNDGRAVQVVSFSIGAHPVTGVVNDQGLVERVETRLFNNVLGDMVVEALFSDYRDYKGVKFPARIQQRQAGHPTLDLTVTSVEPNVPSARALTGPPRQVGPPAAVPSPVRVDAEKIADHVWFLNGGAPVSLLVEFADHVVVIEGPQGDERTEATIAAVKQVTPGKPIRWVVNTHHHFDHSGGVRAFVAAGVPILTHEKNKPYWERILANPFTLGPDRLARAPRRPVIEGVGARRILRDASMTLELHHVRGNLHDEALLMAYLPATKMLVQSDTFHPRPGAAPLAAPPPFTTNLVDNVRRLKLDVQQVVQVHGGIEPWSAVLKAAGQ